LKAAAQNKPVGPYVVPFPQPTIEQVTAPAEAEYPISAGSTLVIRGKGLRGDVTRVRLGGTETLLVPQEVKETQISLLLSPDLRAGVQAIQVVHLTMARPDCVVESNVAAFVLHPKIAATVGQVQSSGSDLRSAEIAVRFNPKVGKAQRVVLLLNEVSSDEAVAYSFTAAPRTDDTDSMMIPVKEVKPGTYLMRVQVDGAESSLNLNQSGEYDSPQVTIP